MELTEPVSQPAVPLADSRGKYHTKKTPARTRGRPEEFMSLRLFSKPPTTLAVPTDLAEIQYVAGSMRKLAYANAAFLCGWHSNLGE